MLAGVAIALGFATPAAAHTGVVLTLYGDGRGSVWLTAQWEDGHAVEGPVGAVLTASSDTGQRAGPAPLRATGDTAGTLTYDGTLGPGRWSVVAEMGTPAIARCQAQVAVSAQAAGAVPVQVRCVAAYAPTTTAPSPDRDTRAIPWWVWVGLVVVIAGGAGALVARRTR